MPLSSYPTSLFLESGSCEANVLYFMIAGKFNERGEAMSCTARLNTGFLEDMASGNLAGSRDRFKSKSGNSKESCNALAKEFLGRLKDIFLR